ncbi:MAG TPA: hypothetical protein VGF85_02460 [Opitutaceae bacterium]|jgi:hypothetical protein
MGPKTFDLVVYDHYLTYDPQAPMDGVNVQGTVTVTIGWNPAGTDVVDAGVGFSDPAWTDTGAGPINLFDEVIGGGIMPLGVATWSVNTSFQRTLEKDTPNNRCRWVITPAVDLIRTITSTIGKPTRVVTAYTATDIVKGGWTPLVQAQV